MSDTEQPTIRDGQRIAKVMARAGLCSRRDAEAWIAGGRVSVNGRVLDSPAYNVNDDDDVRVDGEPLKSAERTRLFLFHKPRGLVTTARDPEGRSTIFDALPEDLPRVVAVGRLDINTEGLLLLTNDGGLSRVLELPSTGWLRRYRVRAHGEVKPEQLEALRDGVTIDGMTYAGIDARFERQQGANVWLTMGLREGKNREIKRVLEHLGLEVNRLIRVSFGPFELGDLGEGEVVEVRTRVLRDQLGAKLAKQAGVDLDSPREEARPPELPPPSLVKAPRGDRRGAAGPAREGRARPASVRPREGGSNPRSGAQSFKGREDRAAIAAELAARGERRETVAPRKRKHVTALRAEAQAANAGPRKRVERSATADRKGREVKVERVMNARPEPAPAPRPSPGGRRFAPRAERPGAPAEEGRRSSRPRPSSEAPREARRFAPRGERSGVSPEAGRRSSRPEPSSEAPREARRFAPRGERSGASPEAGRRSSRPGPSSEAPREARRFAPRGERSDASPEAGRRSSRPGSSSEVPREKRSARTEGQGRRPTSAAKSGDRPRGASGKPAREGRPSRPGGDKPRGGGAKRPPRKG